MNNLINRRYDGEKGMGGYFSKFESMFNKLSVMGSSTGNGMQVDIRLVPISPEESLSDTIYAIKTMDTDKKPGNTYRDSELNI